MLQAGFLKAFNFLREHIINIRLFLKKGTKEIMEMSSKNQLPNWKNVENLEKKWGCIKYNNRLQSIEKGAEINRLLLDAVLEYAKFNSEYYSDSITYWNNAEFPFVWGELQNQAIWFRSFYQALINKGFKKIIVSEFSYDWENKNRKQSKSRKKRIDFWISFMNEKENKEGTILLVEYKHNSQEFDKKSVIKIYTDWEQALCDLNKASGQPESSFKSDHTKNKSKIVKIALMTIVIYRKAKPNNRNTIEPRKQGDFLKQIPELKNGINWSAYWLLPVEQQEKPNKWGEDKKDICYYKGLYFLANVEDKRAK